MAKQVQPGEEIYIAPGITGKRDENGELFIYDDLTGDQLDPKKNIEDKIRIFERQVNEWFLERAHALRREEKNGFIILMIATAYIEGVEQYREGESSENQSAAIFKNGIKRIFGIENKYDNRLSELHKELRCGLFHNGMTGPHIRIASDHETPIDLSDETIININQILFLEKVKSDFEQYLKDLKDTEKTELRENFNSMYEFE